jgi:hypothetical protein
MLQLISEIPVPYKDIVIGHVYVLGLQCVSFSSFYGYWIGFWNCFDGVAYFFPLCWYTLIVNKYIFHFYGYFGIFPKKNIDLFSLIFWKENYNCDIVNENKRADFNESNFIL